MVGLNDFGSDLEYILFKSPALILRFVLHGPTVVI